MYFIINLFFITTLLIEWFDSWREWCMVIGQLRFVNDSRAEICIHWLTYYIVQNLQLTNCIITTNQSTIADHVINIYVYFYLQHLVLDMRVPWYLLSCVMDIGDCRVVTYAVCIRMTTLNFNAHVHRCMTSSTVNAFIVSINCSGYFNVRMFYRYSAATPRTNIICCSSPRLYTYRTIARDGYAKIV